MPKGLPYLNVDELTTLFGYKNSASTLRAMSRGSFPVPTYKLGKFRVADREVVMQYFRDMRDGSIDLRRGTLHGFSSHATTEPQDPTQ